MENITFTKRERDFINLAKKGYSYKAMAEYYGASYHAVTGIAKVLFKKLEVRSIRRMLIKVKQIDDKTPLFDIATEEWQKLYPTGNHTMTERERQFSWEHWLRAWQLAEKRFR